MSPVTVTFDQLVQGLTRPAVRLRAGSRLRIPSEPISFVPPSLVSDADPLSAVVLLVKAPAAVGKTTFSNALGARLGAPLLDLSTIGVSTKSLRGLLGGDIAQPADAQAEFTSGKLPIIVDALDEGRLLSNENNFEEFLDSTWRMLALTATRPTRPCIVLVGRPETWEMVAASLLDYPTVTSQTLSIDFFDRPQAVKLVHAHADMVAKPASPYRSHPHAAATVTDAYFKSVASALQMDEEEVWRSDVGRAFAGYAPVLVALGDVLATTDNFADLTATLRQGATRDAWGSIEKIANWVLDRERSQLQRLLSDQLGRPSPPEVYDPTEQYRLLADYVQRGEIQGSRLSPLHGQEYARYEDLIKGKVPEHPFLRSGTFVNPVFGSLVLAVSAEAGGLVDRESQESLEAAARQPFLWRAIRHRLSSEDTLVDGFLVGYILSSRTADAAEPRAHILVQERDDDVLTVLVMSPGTEELTLSCLGPLRLFAQVADTDVSIEASLELSGVRQGPGGSALALEGSTLVAGRMDINADRVLIKGQVWLEAPAVSSPSRLEVVLADRCRLGWSGQFTDTYPWNRQPRGLYARPGARVVNTRLESLLDLCAQRLTQIGHIVLHANLTLTDDERMNWARRDYSEEFRKLVEVLIDYGFASRESVSASEGAKARVRFDVNWDELFSAVREPAQATTYREVSQKLRGMEF